MNKNLLVIAVVILVAVLAWYGYSRWSGGYRALQGTTGTPPYHQAEAPDTSAAIMSDIQSTGVGNIDQDFKAIDKDLQSL